MYLFQPRDINETQKDNIIYIPLCIYFNTADFGTDFVLIFIYIPLCIYFNLKLDDQHELVDYIYIPLCIYFNTSDISKPLYFANLHSTMYLFQLSRSLQLSLYLLNLHSTMYLFQRPFFLQAAVGLFLFTFHYVSISTRFFCLFHCRTAIYIPLCIYFNLILTRTTKALNLIYIPLCIYFNRLLIVFHCRTIQFTFHYVSISTMLASTYLSISSIFTFHYVSISTICACLAIGS